jgi:hypothetical protein
LIEGRRGKRRGHPATATEHWAAKLLKLDLSAHAAAKLRTREPVLDAIRAAINADEFATLG